MIKRRSKSVTLHRVQCVLLLVFSLALSTFADDRIQRRGVRKSADTRPRRVTSVPAPAPVDPVVEGTGREVGEETGPPVDLLVEGVVGLCTQVVDERGVFVVLPAPIAVEVNGTVTTGYLAVWRDAVSEELFVYDRPLFDEFDVGQSVLNLRRDRDVPIETLTSASVLLEGRVAGAESIDEDATLWQPMTRQLLWRLMGYEWSPYEGEDESLGTVAIECPPERAFGEPGELDCEGLAATPQELSGRLVVVACGCIGRCCANPCLCNRCLCLNCDDRNPCTGDTCNGGRCYHIPLSCSDGIYCNGFETCAAQGCQAGEDPCPPELSCDEEHNACVECIGGGDCDDGDPCTEDSCQGWAFGEGGVAKGKCVNQPLPCDQVECCPDEGCCPSGGECCGGVCCPSGENCCSNGVCCAFPCNECVNYGALSGGTIDVQPPLVCVGGTITWTASGVGVTAGSKRVDCVVTNIPPGGVTYDWTLTLPSGYPAPLPPLTGTGATVNVVAEVAGVYSCSFVARPTRTDCPPADLQIGPQTATAVHIRPDSVTFSGAQMYAISKDDGTGLYPTPHWKDNSTPLDDDNDDVGNHNIPVAYVRNSSITLTAEFTIDPPGGLTDVSPVTITGIGSAGGVALTFTGTAPSTGTTVTLTNATADTFLPNSIQYFNPLSLHWSFTGSNGQPLNCQIPSTNHRIYVLLDPPTATPRFETLFDIACRNGIGVTDAAGAFGLLYSDFTDRDVKRKPSDGTNHQDGVQMRYWVAAGDPLLPAVSSNCQTLAAMLNPSPADPALDGIGTCLAWANLLSESAKSQGITVAAILEVTSARHNDNGLSLDGGLTDRGLFLVKNWSFATTGTAPATCAPFLFGSTEVTDLSGAPGQGATTNPPGAFFNHFIVRFSGMFYDPSYGTGVQATQAAWESASLDGYRKACASGPTIVHAAETAAVETVFVP